MKSAKYSILQAKWHSFYPNGGKFPNPHKILEFCKKCAFWVLFRKSFGEALRSWAASLWALFAAFSSTIGRDVQLLHNNWTQSATFFYGFYLDNMMSTFSSNAIVMSFVSKSIHKSKQTISTIFLGFQSWCLLLLVAASILLCGQMYCIREIDLPSSLSDGSQELFLYSQEVFSSSLCLLCNSSMVDVIFIVITILIILI